MGIAVPIASAGIAAASAGVSIKARKEQADYEEATARNNARAASFQANDAKQRGAYEARQFEIAGRQASAQGAVAAAASGVDESIGVDVAATLGSQADAQRSRANAAREAWGFKVQRESALSAGKFAKTTGLLGQIGIGLSSGSQAIGKAVAAGKAVAGQTGGGSPGGDSGGGTQAPQG